MAWMERLLGGKKCRVGRLLLCLQEMERKLTGVQVGMH
jgi:hypothetical protein